MTSVQVPKESSKETDHECINGISSALCVRFHFISTKEIDLKSPIVPRCKTQKNKKTIIKNKRLDIPKRVRFAADFNDLSITRIEHASEHRKVQESFPERKKCNKWTQEDDDKLLVALAQEGLAEQGSRCRWISISEKVKNRRTAKQCRDRWFNYLRQGIKKGDWTSDEEELIRDLYTTFGGRWCAMTKVLKNRSENDIKNKWHAMQRKLGREQENSKNMITKKRKATETSAHEAPYAENILSSSNCEDTNNSLCFAPRDWCKPVII